MKSICTRSLLLLQWLLASHSILAAQEATLSWTDGTSTSGVFQGLNNKTVRFSAEDADHEQNTNLLRTIRFDTASEIRRAGQPCTVLTLANEDRLVCTDLFLADEVVQITSPVFGEGSLPLETVRNIMFLENFDLQSVPELRRPIQDGDIVHLKNGDSVRGTTASISAEELVIETSLGKIPIPRENIRAISFDPALLIATEERGHYQTVELQDGSWLTTTSTTVDVAGRCELHHAFDLRLTTQPTQLRKISCYTETIVSLLTRTPVSVHAENYFGEPVQIMTNRNYRQQPLVTAGTHFLRGLGMTSKTTSTYIIEPGDQFLLVQAGVDDSAADAGSLEMRIAIDDQIVWSAGVITSSTGLISVPAIPLVSGKTFSLIVDYGPQADIQDLANWCDPVIIRRSQ